MPIPQTGVCAFQNEWTKSCKAAGVRGEGCTEAFSRFPLKSDKRGFNGGGADVDANRDRLRSE